MGPDYKYGLPSARQIMARAPQWTNLSWCGPASLLDA
jgi:hypothetical protein